MGSFRMAPKVGQPLVKFHTPHQQLQAIVGVNTGCFVAAAPNGSTQK
jgi:hypothetical protein